MKIRSKEKELFIFEVLAQPTHLTKVFLPHLDPDSLNAGFYQIHKPKVMPILHTCILNVSVEVERNISQLVQWGSITRMPKLEASYFVKFSSTLLHPVFAHEANTLLMKNIMFCIFDRKMMEMILCSDHLILSSGSWFQYVPILMMFTWITWLKWLLSSFSTVKLLSPIL